MSYLQIPKGIQDFNKAVISFWFRAPKESVLAALGHTGPGGPATAPAIRFPLIVFGKPKMQQNFSFLYGDILVNPVTGFHHFEAFYGWETVGDPYDVGPCYVGLVCYSDGTFDLEFNLQMDTYGDYEAVDWVATSATYHVDGIPRSYVLTLKDASPTILYGPPEYFYVRTVLSSDPLSGGLDALKPDIWHHLLLSFDLTGPLSIGDPFASSSCQMWYAIDDQDYRGPKNMGPNRDAPDAGGGGGDGLGPNTILTNNIYRYSGTFSDNFMGEPVPLPPRGNYNPGKVPTSDQEFGIPGTHAYVNDVSRVELAEFQMFTGVTLDTSGEKNRRAFIDYERDANGNPVKDKDGKFTLIPVAPAGEPAPAEKLLNKKPEILLHGSNRWINGENTGTTGVDYSKDPPEVKQQGQFQPTGGIKAYTPDPSLSKSGSSTRRKAGPVRLTQRA